MRALASKLLISTCRKSRTGDWMQESTEFHFFTYKRALLFHIDHLLYISGSSDFAFHPILSHLSPLISHLSLSVCHNGPTQRRCPPNRRHRCRLGQIGADATGLTKSRRARLQQDQRPHHGRRPLSGDAKHGFPSLIDERGRSHHKQHGMVFHLFTESGSSC